MTPIILPLAAPLPPARTSGGDPPLVEARVLQSAGDGTWIVSTGSKTVVVTAEQPLEVGQTVFLPAPRTTGPQTHSPHATPAQTPPVPAVSTRRADALPRLLAALASQAATGPPEPAIAVAARVLGALDAHPRLCGVPEQALAGILSVLRPVAAPHEPASTADVLKRAVEDAGTLFEAKVARLLTASPDVARLPAGDVRTLVGTVLSTLVAPAAQPTSSPAGDSLAARDAWPAEALRAALANAGESVLSAQVQTAAHAEAHGTWRVEIPLQFGDRPVHLDLEFEPDREADGRGGRGRPQGRLHVLVTPQGASPLEARLSWRGQHAIAVDLYVDSEGRAAALAGGREPLAERLRAVGFADVTVDVWTNPARLARWATRRAGAPPAGTALDTRA